MLNTIIFEPFIAIKKDTGDRHCQPKKCRTDLRDNMHVKFMHYTDKHFDNPIMQLWLKDETWIYIQMKKLVNIDGFTRDFMYWKIPQFGKVKYCKSCAMWKPLDTFHNDSNKRDGKATQCYSCQRYVRIHSKASFKLNQAARTFFQ